MERNSHRGGARRERFGFAGDENRIRLVRRLRFVWSDTRGAKFRRILVNGRPAPRYTARIRRVITLYVYGGDPFVGPLLSVHRVIYRGKPTYRAAPRHRHRHRALTHPVLPAAAREFPKLAWLSP